MSAPGSRWSSSGGLPRGAGYDAPWAAMAARGMSVHGEVDRICRYEPRSVLDAGCGTGRVAIELAARGIDVVGVDLDPPMLAEASAKAAHLTWVEGDLATVDLGRCFEIVAMPGNVMIFVHSGTERAVVANMARHLDDGGLLIAGFQLRTSYTLDQYDADCAAAGLSLRERSATWEGDPYVGGDYAVSVHANDATVV